MMVLIIVNCVVPYIAVVDSLKHLELSRTVEKRVVRLWFTKLNPGSEKENNYFGPYCGMQFLVFFIRLWF